MDEAKTTEHASPKATSPYIRFFLVVSCLFACGSIIGGTIIHFVAPSSPTLFALYCLVLLSGGTALLMTAATYQNLREDFTHPLRLVADSAKHMVRGDITTPIPATDLEGPIGDLARSLEQLRQYFTEPADIAIAAPHGLVPLKLNGGAKAVFEQLQNAMTTALDSVSAAATQLHDHAAASRMDSVDMTTQLSRMHRDAMQAAMATQEAQEKAVQSLNHVIPALEERVSTLTEIARLTGMQTETTLRQLQQSSAAMQDAAQASVRAGQNFLHQSEALSGHMFAAVTLLREGGSAISGAGETITSLANVSSRLIQAATHTDQLAMIAQRAASGVERMETTVKGLGAQGTLLSAQTENSRRYFSEWLDTLKTLQQDFSSIIQTTAANSSQLGQLLDHLRLQHEYILTELSRGGGEAAEQLAQLADAGAELIARIEAQLAVTGTAAHGELQKLHHITADAELTNQRLEQAARLTFDGSERINQAAGTIENRLGRLDREIDLAIENIVARTHDMVGHGEARVGELLAHIGGLVQSLTILNNLAETMGQATAQLNDFVPQLLHGNQDEDLMSLRRELRMVLDGIGIWQNEIAATISALPERLQDQSLSQIEPQLTLVLGQIEAARQEVLSAMSFVHDGVNRRLDQLDDIGGFIADHVTAAPHNLATNLGNVLNALGRINGQLRELDARFPSQEHIEHYSAPELLTAPHGVNTDERALAAMTNIFASLRDRGDDVISKLNDMAAHLQDAADKTQKES